MSKLVTIFGGSGFVGRYIARRMAKQGWRVRVAVRRPNEALFVKPYGAVGQVEPVLCNIRDDASVQNALDGADAVVNCVGILAESGKNRFDAVQASGAGRIARLTAEKSIKTLVHISAIGADENSDSSYSQSKAKGEAEVLLHKPDAIILRPSIIFGSEDEFFNRFANMAANFPVVPLVGANTRFQPVYVDDVAHAAEIALLGCAPSGIYELGGQTTATFRELMRMMLNVVERKSVLLPLPFFVAAVMAWGLDFAKTISLGLFPNKILTKDQVRNLRHDNIVSDNAKGFSDLGITPTAIEAVLPNYLCCFRPSGQYAAIKNSAKGLKS